jgi:hypothetical protein
MASILAAPRRVGPYRGRTPGACAADDAGRERLSSLPNTLSKSVAPGPAKVKRVRDLGRLSWVRSAERTRT